MIIEYFDSHKNIIPSNLITEQLWQSQLAYGACARRNRLCGESGGYGPWAVIHLFYAASRNMMTGLYKTRF